MKRIEPMAGSHIDKACKELVENAPAWMDFNGIRLEAKPGDSAGDLVGRYHTELERLRKEYEASPQAKKDREAAERHPGCGARVQWRDVRRRRESCAVHSKEWMGQVRRGDEGGRRLMPKPTPSMIAAALPISRYPGRGDDPIRQCNVCGKPSEQLSVWREHDERDRPLSGHGSLVFVGVDHPACRKAIDGHLRLYAEQQGNPGHFPLLCGPCTHREGFGCLHPKLKANGGPGLKVEVGGFLPGAFICSRGRSVRPVARAVECEGRETTESSAMENL